MPVCPHCGKSRTTNDGLEKHLPKCPENPGRHYAWRAWENGKQYANGRSMSGRL